MGVYTPPLPDLLDYLSLLLQYFPLSHLEPTPQLVLVLVHSYVSFTKHFCTRSSIVHRPPSRLHFLFNQEVSL
jgi:hypothetical protein